MKFMRPAFLLLLPALLIAGCADQEPKKYPSVEMTESEVEALRAALARLDAAIAKTAPLMHSHLSPGASEEEISQLRSALGGAVHQPLEEWFSWRNGTEFYGVAYLPLGYPISIEQALMKREQTKGIPL